MIDNLRINENLFEKLYLGRVRKPSQRQQGIDPLAPLTPAPPKQHRHQHQVQQQIPKTPVPATFAFRQIQASQNKRAAAVLFTPCTPNQRGQVPARQQHPSPTPYSAHSPVQSNVLPVSGSGSNVEDNVRAGLERLNLQPNSSSGSQSPCAGPHSRQPRARPVQPKTKGKADDVWTFFEETGNKRKCTLCQ